MKTGTKTYLTIVAFMISAIAYSQERIEAIENVVSKIDKDETLSILTLDANDVYKTTFDGGGTFSIIHNDTVLIKLESITGTSFGRVTTIVYYNHGKPIKIIDQEENFLWNEEKSGWDYSEINVVFSEEIYVFDMMMEDCEFIKHGQRVVTDSSCSCSEYSDLVELGISIFKEATHE